jgi:hypothetical protein
MWGGLVNVMPQPLYPQEWPSAQCIETGCKKSFPPGFIPWIIHPVTSHCTDYGIVADVGMSVYQKIVIVFTALRTLDLNVSPGK